jgi:hypothetical protein
MLFLPRPTKEAVRQAERRYLHDHTITVLDEDTLLRLVQKVRALRFR